MIDFSNKNILVTGGSRGIGKEIAHLLADLGGSVVITGTKEIRLFEDNNIEYKKVDFTNEAELNGFLEEIEKRNFDVVINNAAMNIKEDFLNISDDLYSNIMNVNLIAPIKIIQAVIEDMKKKKYGRIVNISCSW